MTARPGRSETVTQYGVQTPYSSTVLTVTTNRSVAESALEWILDGRIVARTVTTTTWQHPADEYPHVELDQAG